MTPFFYEKLFYYFIKNKKGNSFFLSYYTYTGDFLSYRKACVSYRENGVCE